MKRKSKQEYQGANIRTRYLVFIALISAVFLYLILGVYDLQINNSEDYVEKSESRSTKTIALRGSRGMITDADAVILAKDEQVYNVTFYRDASESDYISYTDSIFEANKIIEKNGNTLSTTFIMKRSDDDYQWEFNFGSGVSESVLQTRESQWRSNNYLTVGRYPTAGDCLTLLKRRYRINTFSDLGVYTSEELYRYGLIEESAVSNSVYTLMDLQQMGLLSLPNVKACKFLTDSELLMLFPNLDNAASISASMFSAVTLSDQTLMKLGKLTRSGVARLGITNAEDLAAFDSIRLSGLLQDGILTEAGAQALGATVSNGKITSKDRILMTEDNMCKVMSVFSEMQMNLYNSTAIVIAKDVPYETVIEIETRSMALPGMEVAIGTKRVYPRGTLASQVIGYIGAIPSTSKWLEIKDQGYKFSDDIGLEGIEASMEDWLTQNTDLRQGFRVVERDSVGKITREISYTEPKDGDNVKLTIVASYQQAAERALAQGVAVTREVE